MITKQVKINVKFGETTITREFPVLRPESMADVKEFALQYGNKAQAENPQEFVWDALQYYAEYTNVRPNGRNTVLAEVEGPSKVIEATAKALLKAGLADTLEAARETVVAGRKAKGLPV